jgi:hypothetical protein
MSTYLKELKMVRMKVSFTALILTQIHSFGETFTFMKPHG